MQPGVINETKIKTSSNALGAMDKVAEFMKACKTIGIKDHNIFSVNDLLGQGNGSKVMHTLQELRKLANPTAAAGGHDGHEQRKSTEKKLDDPTTTQTTTTTTSFPTAAAAAEVKVLPFFSFFCLSCSHTFPFLLLF